MESVVVVTVPDVDRAKDLRRELDRLHEEYGVKLEASAIVQRAVDGRITVHEEEAGPGAPATVGGTAIGAVVGLLTGPVGLLAGAATGAVVGALVDTAEGEDAHGVIDAMKSAIAPGTAAVVAIMREPTPTLLDRAAAAHDGRVLRRPRGEVELRMAEEETARLAERDAAEDR